MTTRRPMSRGAAVLIWLPVAILVPGSLADLWVPGITGLESPPIVFLLFSVITALFAGIGALLVTRQPANTVGWILWIVGLMVGLNQASGAYGEASLVWFDGNLPATPLAAWIFNSASTPPLAIALLFLPLVFPDGRLPSRAWRWVLWAFLAVVVEVGLPDMLRPGLIGASPFVNPLGWTGDPRVLDVLSAISSLSAPIAMPIAIGASVVRYRRGTATERQQLKWFGAAAALSVIGLVVAVVGQGLPFSVVAWILAIIGLCLIPVAIAIAILRYRLFEIDRIISRTVSYGVVTGILALVFIGTILVSQTVLASFFSGSSVAVAASTLVVAALFQPLRRRVQSVVDRRFNRSRYDAERTAAAFGARLRDEVDLANLNAEVRQVVAATVAPAIVGLWIRQPDARS